VLQGGAADGMRFLYPYEGTVFPRGLGSPLVMWEGSRGDFVYVRMTADAYVYTGCVRAEAPGRVRLPAAAWENAERQTLGKGTPFTIELTSLDDGVVRGPITRQVTIARGTLRGSIYYNTYSGGLEGAARGAPAGLIERIKPGSKAEFFSRSFACTGCHSASANGERLVTAWSPGYVFSIGPSTAPDPAPLRVGANMSFVGLSPDGQVYLTTASGFGPGPRTQGIALTIPQSSILTETDSGNTLANSGFPTSALMPTFSPDGTLATFGDQQRGGTTLALMDYDAARRTATNQREIFDAKGAGFAGWPFVLPDNKAVVFTLTESPDFSGGGAFIAPGLFFGPRSDLWMVDLQDGKAFPMARAIGFDSVGDVADDRKSYLPFGAGELHQNYYPTVSPVASGGYFWVFFDSVRHYGNLGLRRQLWGTAIEVSDGEGDRSNPAFYVSGQVLETANHRAFTALNPCLPDGASCAAGVDCCAGSCASGTCGSADGCAAEDEACGESDDCCDPRQRCINGFCGTLLL
jgi:hypothetical protein